jgi:lysine 2,3-aminomutase
MHIPTSFITNEEVIRRFWPNVTQIEWNDWRWQMTNRLRTIDELVQLLNLTPYQISKFKRVLNIFPYAVTPYYLSLIDWNDPHDPIRRQSLPDPKEVEYCRVGHCDPLEEEEDMAVPGLVHRYPDRVLAIVTNTCSMYCRHCTRKRIWRNNESACSKLDLNRMIEYIRATKEIREVVISGGDPLTLPLGLLESFLADLSAIPHVQVMRIGTRVPVVLPMRITDDLVKLLAKFRPLWVNTQFNHPREITPEAQEACDKLLRAGIPVSNQSVLLRGINDSVEIMRELCHNLQRIMVRPYYLYQCDPVMGVEHLRTNVWKGIQIIEMMRGYTSGLCIPTFVIDAPSGGGKIPLQPFYLLSATDKEVLLRNYEGMIVNYYNPSENDNDSRRRTEPPVKESGTAQLLRGNDRALVPEKNPRIWRRRQKNMLISLKEENNDHRPDL